MNLRISICGAIIACFLVGCPQTADFEGARQKLLQVADLIEAANAASAAGDREAMERHGTAASELIAEARQIYEEGNAAESSDAHVLVGYGDVLRQGGDYDLAAQMYRGALADIQDDATLWLTFAKSLTELNDSYLDEARAALEQCLAITEDDRIAAEAHGDLATVYRRMGLYELAADELEQTLALRPDDGRARIFWAAHLARRGRVRDAADELDRLQGLTGESGFQLRELLGSAMSDFELYRHVFDDSAANHLAYAKLLLRIERNMEALPALERSVFLNPDDYIAWNLLGSIARANGNNHRAREGFERSLALNPDQPRTVEALQELGTPEVDAGRLFAPKRIGGRG